jgi:hypothetical protein
MFAYVAVALIRLDVIQLNLRMVMPKIKIIQSGLSQQLKGTVTGRLDGLQLNFHIQ